MIFDGGYDFRRRGVGRGEVFGGRGVAALVVVRGAGPRAPRRVRPVGVARCRGVAGGG